MPTSPAPLQRIAPGHQHGETSSGVRTRAGVPSTKRPYEPDTPLAPTLGPRAKQRQLPLLRIEAHQGADNLFLHQDLVLGITSIELPALDPLRVALLPQRKFP